MLIEVYCTLITVRIPTLSHFCIKDICAIEDFSVIMNSWNQCTDCTYSRRIQMGISFRLSPLLVSVEWTASGVCDFILVVICQLPLGPHAMLDPQVTVNYQTDSLSMRALICL